MTTNKYISMYLVILFIEFVFLTPTFTREKTRHRETEKERLINFERDFERLRFILQKMLVYIWIQNLLQ